VYLLLSVFCCAESYASQQLPYQRSNRAEKSGLPYLMGIIVLLVFWLCIYDSAKYLPANSVQILCCSVAVIAGVILRFLSIKHLNIYFLSHISCIDKHRLITSGVYSIVRHPSELGLLLICSGLAIFTSSVSAIILTAVLVFLSLYRIRLEDAMLQKMFPQQFSNYAGSTRGLIPGLPIRARS